MINQTRTASGSSIRLSTEFAQKIIPEITSALKRPGGVELP
jgi:hypothetical protein